MNDAGDRASTPAGRRDKAVWRAFALSFCAVIALGGCSTTDTMPGPAPAQGAIHQELSKSANNAHRTAKPAQPEQPPEAVRQALVPKSQPLGRSQPRQEHRFDLTVNDAPAQQFFMGLVEGTPYNMVVHPSVKGTISLHLKDVTVPEVMEAVREVYGYEYKRTETGFYVLPNRPQTRIFHVDYLDVQRSGKSETRVSSGEVTGASNSNSNSNNNNSSSSSSGSVQAISGTQVETKSSSDFWKELNQSLHAIVAVDPGSTVVVSPQAGLVVVRTRPDVLREVTDYLRGIQSTMKRQVILEAKILEVQLSNRFQSGINWAALGEPANGQSIVTGQVGGGTVFSDQQSEIAGNTGVLNPQNLQQLEGTATSAFGGVFSLALNLRDFTAFIELLKTQGNVQVLSSPRVSTVNNQKAVIKVGSDEFFVTDISSTNTVTGTSTQPTQDITLTPFFSGIALDVTPQIDAKGWVTLHVHPSVSDVQDQTKQLVVNGTQQTLPLAFSTIRESDSIVRAKSGQVIVIGGLMKDETNDQDAGVPWLSEVPLVGNLFKHKRNLSNKTELVILLRPIVVDSNTWGDVLHDAADRVGNMDLDKQH